MFVRLHAVVWKKQKTKKETQIIRTHLYILTETYVKIFPNFLKWYNSDNVLFCFLSIARLMQGMYK